MKWPFGRKRRRSSRSRSRSRDRSFSTNVPLLRWLGPSFTGSGVLGLIFMAVTGRIDLSVFDRWIGSESVVTDGGEQVARGPLARNPTAGSPIARSPIARSQGNPVSPVSLSLGNRSADTIRIATFNIQFFGPSKMAEPQTMQTIARVVSQFDVVAIQEVRNGKADPVGALADLLQASGANYGYTVSESIGKGDRYKEAYAFLYDRSRIAMIPDSAYLVQDPGGLMSREPMVASFETRSGTRDGRKPFRFTLVNAHTSPSEVAANAIINEMNVLDDVFVSVRNYEYEMAGEEDLILLGDLNVDTKNLRELGQIPGVISVAGDLRTNTRRDKTYDHILIDRHMTREFTGRYGLLDLQDTFGLNEEQALRISDHQPLWAEFTINEAPAPESPALGPLAAGASGLR